MRRRLNREEKPSLMDEEMFNAQCRDVAKCIEGLRQALLEAEGSISMSKIVTEIHQLLQSFRLLGSHYKSELELKCRELEMKNQEVKELSCKLEKIDCRGRTCSAGDQEPERPMETAIRADCEKSGKELPTRQQFLGELPRTNSEILQTSKIKSEELDKALEDIARLKVELDVSRADLSKVQEKVGKAAVFNEPLLRYNEALENGPGERRCFNCSMTGGKTEKVDFLQSSDMLRPVENSSRKHNREFIEMVSDLEGKKSCKSTLLPMTRKSDNKQVFNTSPSQKMKAETRQVVVAEEQNMVEILSKAMEHYEQRFLEKPSAFSACNVGQVSTLGGPIQCRRNTKCITTNQRK